MKRNSKYTAQLYDFLTGKASTAVARRLHRNLKQAQIDISAEQWSILYQLWKKEGISQQELATQTFKDKPSITRLLHNLEKLNLVVRIPHQTDRRTKLIYLTKKGKDLKDNGMERADQTLQEALQEVSAEDIQICNDVLKKVFSNLK